MFKNAFCRAAFLAGLGLMSLAHAAHGDAPKGYRKVAAKSHSAAATKGIVQILGVTAAETRAEGKVEGNDKEARVHFYLHCDAKTDGRLDQTDEIYLVTLWGTNAGFYHTPTRGPDDFRDGGKEERWRNYDDLVQITLKDGEYLNGSIIVMESDGNIVSQLAGLIEEALGPIGKIPAVQIPAAIGEAAAKVTKKLTEKGDQRLGTFHVYLRNDKGNLEFRVNPEGKKIEIEKPFPHDAMDGSKIVVHPFRMKDHDANYHVGISHGMPGKR